METRKSGLERGAEETMMRNHHIGASASTLRDPAPSREDRALTQWLVDAGKLLGIPLIDHVVIVRRESAK
jgi:DNA repair protein RadC